MHILQVNAVDGAGGAAGIARLLHDSALSRGHHSALVVGRSDSDRSGVIQLDHDAYRGPWFGLTDRLYRSAIRHSGRMGLWRLVPLLRELRRPGHWWSRRQGHLPVDFPASWRLLDQVDWSVDVVNLHNLHDWFGYFDLRALPSLCRQVPVVLTMHDMWLCTGHCAHAMDCDHWLNGCGACPDLSIYMPIRRDATARNLAWRRKIYQQCRLHVIGPSQWVVDTLRRSVLQEAVVDAQVIANGVDRRLFCPADRSAARRELGLPIDQPIVLFAAVGARYSEFKDYHTLEQAVTLACEHRDIPPVLFVALGEEGQERSLGRSTMLPVDFIADRRRVASYFQAADVYLHAARADTFPSVILEAMACGCPVIATDVGGIGEQVADGQTGYLVPVADARAMAVKLAGLLSDRDLARRMGEAAAERVAAHFDQEQQVAATLDYYRRVCADQPASGSVSTR